MKLALIVAAGGRGTRVKANTPKQFFDVKGRRLLEWTLGAFSDLDSLEYVCVGVPEEYLAVTKSLLPEKIAEKTTVYTGGITRCGTVKKGVALLLNKNWDVLLIHDGARPLIARSDVEKIVTEAFEHGICVPGCPERNTLRRVESGFSRGTVSRNGLWEIYTPQAFRKDVVEKMYEIWPDESDITDDAAIAEQIGIKVKVVKTGCWNIKVTFDEDFLYIRRLL